VNYDHILEKEYDVFGRLSQRVSDSKDNSAKFAAALDACTQRARDHLAARQAEREDNFRKRNGEHAHAKEVRDTKMKETLKEFKVRNTKERAAFESRYAREMADRESKHEEMTKKLARSKSDFAVQGCLSRPEFHHMVECNKSMKDIVAFNRNLLRRAHAYHQEQELDKIQGMRDKVKALVDSRATAATRRQSMIKNCAIEKHHLSMQVESAKSGGVSKMNKILATMEPDEEGAKRINELLTAMNMELLPGTKVDDE
jgi:hypothetical protein